MIAFGPVPSRRLGRSLGINNIPPKTCTYSCVYCQLGRTLTMQTTRSVFYPLETLVAAVEDAVTRVRASGEKVDYLTFVPDGEPTLDTNLGAGIAQLRKLGIRIAVISNASLIGSADVRAELSHADWVSLKVDAVDASLWRRVDRPHRSLRLDDILDGVLAFARSYRGELVTETMLVRDVNDHRKHLRALADFLGRVAPAAAYLSVPTRPPTEAWAQIPREETLNQAFQTVQERVERVEYLIGYEGNAFSFTGDVREDLLSITSVHPMREEAVHELLERNRTNWDVVEELLRAGELVSLKHNGHRFYMRALPGRKLPNR